MVAWDLVGCAVVGFVWGTTNALLERGVKASSSGILRAAVALPYVANQAGSLLFYILLSSAEVSVVGPLTNALTLIFTGIATQVLSSKTDRNKSAKRQWPVIALGASMSFSGLMLCQHRA